MKLMAVGGVALLQLVAACTDEADSSTTVDPIAHHDNTIRNDQLFRNANGFGATYSTAGFVDLDSDFFTDFGTNGRTCGSCHHAEDGWTITPATAQQVFEQTNGRDPLFHNNDGTNSPNADQSTTSARRRASSMLLSKGLIRVGIGIPANAEFELASVDDPYHYASATELSMFRRPLASMNLFFLSTVMWDGRETFVDTNQPHLADSNCLKPPFALKCFLSVDPYDLKHQAQDATLGHAQAEVPGLSDAQQGAIVDFESSLMFAQVVDDAAGRLDARGANGGPDAIPTFPGYFGLNDNFGDYDTNQPFTNIIFNIYDAWANLPDDHNHFHDHDYDGRNDDRRAVARGQAIFNTRQFTISDVAGLNGAVGLPASFSGTCGTCHNALNAGDHTIPLPLNIGVAEASLRTADLPLYTLRCSAVGAAAGHCTAGQTHQVTDPGRALITGLWADIAKFKGPTLRGLGSRAPYFHNGSAADIGAVVDFYNTRFNINFTKKEKSDLVAFLRTL